MQEQQVKVKQDVGGVISLLLNRDAPSYVVHKQTGQRRVTSYLVKMVEVKDACDINAKCESFFAGSKDSRPAALSGILISNWTTPGTKVCIAIMKVQAERYGASNPGSQVQEVGYEAIPLIHIIPPPDSSYCRVKVFNFIEAVKSLPTNFTPEGKSSIVAKANMCLCCKMRLFILLLDDDFEKINRGTTDRAKISSMGRNTKHDNVSPSSASSKSARVDSQSLLLL